jgi:hypothetical protein
MRTWSGSAGAYGIGRAGEWSPRFSGAAPEAHRATQSAEHERSPDESGELTLAQFIDGL